MYPTLYQPLRDRDRWEAVLCGLTGDEDGVLGLARVPLPRESLTLPGPYETEPSGVAAAACDSVFVADTEDDRIEYLDGLCDARALLPGGAASGPASLLDAPRGLAVSRDLLAVCDTGHARVLLFRLSNLELARVLSGPFADPVAVAFHADGGLLVLDAALPRILHMDLDGHVDAAVTDALANALVGSVAMATDGLGRLWVSDAAAEEVLRFDARGVLLDALATPQPGWRPRAIAARGARGYIADAQSGRIVVFDDTLPIGEIPGYRAPVSALDVAEDGTLLIKPGLDAQVIVADADAAVVASGQLETGPLDAGDRDGWERVRVDAQLVQGAGVDLEVYYGSSDSPPLPSQWRPAPSVDLLLSTLDGSSGAGDVPRERRYLWLRVRLRAASATVSPRLMQVECITADERYLEHLPAVYAEQDTAAVLERFLALARTEVGGGERLLEDLPRSLTPQFAASGALQWLAQWLAFDLPDGLAVERRREILARVHDLYRRRGTIAGLIEFVHLYTGVRPKVVEWYRARHVWSLGETSALGFDTALPGASAEGMVVPDPAILEQRGGASTCDSPEHLVVGHAVVGVDRPAAATDLGVALFADHAHRLSVVVPAHVTDAATRDRIRAIVEAERPAHVLGEVCFTEADLRIGVNARIGLDAVIGGDHAPARLGEASLGQRLRLGPAEEGAPRLGQGARIGEQARLGTRL